MIRRHHLLTRISDIDRSILNMGIHVEEALRKAVKTLEEGDEQGAGAVIADDSAINAIEMTIQDEIILLIAKEQPVAGDLRHIITSFRIIAQLERMGDHAVHIAKEVLKIQGIGQEVSLDMPVVRQMAEIGIDMLSRALDAYAGSDPDKARSVAADDDLVDDLQTKMNEKLMTSMLKEIQPDFRLISSLLFIGRWLERFADHVTNICEWVIYDSEGVHVELNL